MFQTQGTIHMSCMIFKYKVITKVTLQWAETLKVTPLHAWYVTLLVITGNVISQSIKKDLKRSITVCRITQIFSSCISSSLNSF